MSAIFDASVVVKWFVEDPLADAAVEARRSLRPALAPDFMLVEVANAMRRYVVKGDLAQESARESLSIAAEVIELVDHSDLVDEAFALACRFNHSITDCLYVVLARRMSLPLVTADTRLAKKLSGLDGLEIRMIG